MNIREVLETVKREARNKRAPRTAATYSYGLDAFLKHLENEEISPDDDIATLTMEPFIFFPGWLAENKYSKQTTGVYMASTRFLLNWLVINSYLLPDYRETVRYDMAMNDVFKRRETKLPRWPQKGEAEKVRDAAYHLDCDSPERERNIALVQYLYSSGCRNDEAVRLAVKDIDFTNNSAKVTGKGSKERIVFFSSIAAEAIKNYWQVRGYSDQANPVFARHDKGAGRKRKPITWVTTRNIVDNCVKMSGMEKGTFTPHYFRHAFAIRMLAETHDLALVQDLMGHATPIATRVYAKIYPEDLQKAYKEVYG